MVDVTIKNVPEGAETKVKELAIIAIERFIMQRDVKVTEAITSKFESDVDAIRVANSLDKKYKKEDKIKTEIPSGNKEIVVPEDTNEIVKEK